ncbi:hypothetical protein JYU34_019271 [Plutella xylostella]|uniref:MICOS complex subunit MIC60 n=1 Tax=Plutella xylostella TaxID=51655 RepID=A0ABQ7PWF2_PLUXY|nr:hypothetical protein JYU34_019271 [Plutella xylostella]
MTYQEFLECSWESTKQYVARLGDDTKKPKQCSLTEDGSEPVEDLESPPEDVENEGSEHECPPVQKPPILTQDLCEIEKCVKTLGELALKNLLAARDACINYNKVCPNITKLKVMAAMDQFTLSSMDGLDAAAEEREALVKEQMDSADEATAKLDELCRYFECGVVAPAPDLAETRKVLDHYQREISRLRNQFECEHEMAAAVDKYWKNIEQVMRSYVHEVETLYPGLQYDSPKPQIPKDGNVDLLLYHAARYVKSLREQLQVANQSMGDRVDRALQSLPGDKKARDNKVDASVKKKMREIDTDFAAKLKKMKEDHDKELKAMLQKRQEDFEECVDKKVEEQEQILQEEMNQKIEEALQAEREVLQKELDEMAAKVKVVEEGTKEKLQGSQQSGRSGRLYRSGAALLAATRQARRRAAVASEISDLESAAGLSDEGEGEGENEADKLMLAVVGAIPARVRSEGVATETSLRERYDRMERIALRVALVDSTGGPLPVYVMSYLQSLFLFMKLNTIPKCELEVNPEEPVPSDLDTFDLLQRARFWMNSNNIPNALRYVDALKGASRTAANPWYEDAKDHVETRQAAEAIMAYAKALATQYL